MSEYAAMPVGACVNPQWRLFFDGRQLEPIATKTVARKFFDQIFLYEAHCSYILPVSYWGKEPKL